MLAFALDDAACVKSLVSQTPQAWHLSDSLRPRRHAFCDTGHQCKQGVLGCVKKSPCICQRRKRGEKMKAQLLSGIARASGRALNTLNNRSLHVRSAQRMGGCAPIGEVTLADQAQASAGRPGETMAFRCCFAVYHPHRSVSSTLPISRHISIRSLHAAPRPKFVRAASGSQDPRGPESSAQSGLVGRVAGGLAIFLAGSIALASPALAKPFGSPFTEPPVYVAPEVRSRAWGTRCGRRDNCAIC